MAAPSKASIDTVLRVLRLQNRESDDYIDTINDYFGSRDASSDESNCEDSDTDHDESDSESFTPVTVDPADALVPSKLRRQHVSDNSSPEPSIPAATAIPKLTPPAGKKFSCNCSLNNGQPCHTAFSDEEIDSFRLQYITMTKEELDISILSKLSCTLRMDEFTRRPKQKEQTVRKASRADYFHHGYRICRELFKYIHDIGQDKLTALIKHYKTNGVEPRVHKNKKKAPTNALSFQDIRRIVDFIVNYAEVHSIMLPGRTPNHWKSDAKLLPTNCTKKIVHEQYVTAALEGGFRAAKISSFRDLWQRLLPHIRTMPPASDLCWVCQKGATKVMRNAGKADDQKTEALRELEQHQEDVKKERQNYQTLCLQIESELPPGIEPGKHEPCSFRGRNHISFDYAQQMHYPSDPLQPGPIYFKTPRKCGLFWNKLRATKNASEFPYRRGSFMRKRS